MSIQISKSDLLHAIRYLRDAAKLYTPAQSTPMANRARLINNLINKLNNKLLTTNK